MTFGALKKLTAALAAGMLITSGTAFAEETQPVKEGARGDDVRVVQELLIAWGYLTGEADGICGSQTVEAIKKFQEAAGLTADGVCGPNTLAALKKAEDAPLEPTETAPAPSTREYVAVGGIVKQGTYGEGVRQVQQSLIDLGYLNDEADGVCGNNTVEAIRRFQQDSGLTADGVCGADTYKALGSGGSGSSSETTFFDRYKLGKSFTAYVTAYSAEDPGNGSHTASGKRLTRGMIAVDPEFLPLGTRVYIPGYGEAVAEDIGTHIKGNHIDVAFSTRAEALAFGLQEIEVYILDDLD